MVQKGLTSVASPKGIQPPKAQRAVCNSDSTCWKTAPCPPSSTGSEHLVWKKDGNEHRAGCSLLLSLLPLQWEAGCSATMDFNRRTTSDKEFTAAASWEKRQRWDTAVHPAEFHRGYNQRENLHTLGNWSIWSEMISVHLIRAKPKLFWNQVWEICCLCKLLC